MNNVNATASCTAKMSVLYLALNKREQYNYISKTKGVRQISLLKRETGVNPVRTRHRILRVKADDHWVTGKGAGASDQ